MPDYVSSEERALIDAALEAGQVVVVPAGASAYAGYVYNPQTRRVELKEPRPQDQRYNGTFSGARDRMNASRAAAGRVRRDAIVELVKAGKPSPEIANMVGIHRRSVNKIIKELKQEGRLPE